MIRLGKTFDEMSSNMEKKWRLHPRDGREKKAFRAFQSEIDSYIARFMIDPNAGETLSLRWMEECFKLPPMVNNAFVKLLVELRHPTSRLGSRCVEGYLTHSSKYMNELARISSFLHHLAQARVSLSIGILLAKTSPSDGIPWLRPITVKEIKSEKNPLLERFRDAELDEVTDLNKIAARLTATLQSGQSCEEEVEELSRKLEEFEKLLDKLQEIVKKLFIEVLSTRSKLISYRKVLI